MRTVAARAAGFAGAVFVTLMMVGCSYTKVNFTGPPGTVLTVNDKPYHLPAQVELERGGAPGESKRHPVSVVLTSPQGKEVRAKGTIDVFGYNESDVDRLAVSTCHLDETQLVKVEDGAVIIFKGDSASRQPLYELKFGKQ